MKTTDTHPKKKNFARYRNEVNTLRMRNWTAEEMNFFFAVLTKAKDHGHEKIVFTKKDIDQLFKPDPNLPRQRATLERLARHITELRYSKVSSTHYTIIPLFTFFDIEWNEAGTTYTITVQVHEDFEYILNELKENFTSFLFDDFVKVKGTYAKTLFRICKQFRSTGMAYLSKQDFMADLGVPESYRESKINEKVLKPAIRELSTFFEGIEVEKIRSKEGRRPVAGYRFTWKPEEKPVPKNTVKQKGKAEPEATYPEWYGIIPDEPATAEDLAAVLKLQEEVLSSGRREAEERRRIEEARRR